jgi:hypothetical protein
VDSLEGQNERREHERLRKAAKRARVAEPPPLLPVNPGAPGQPPTQAGDSVGPLPGQSAALGTPPPVPWEPELLTDLLGELMDAAEEGRVAMFAAKCQEGGLMPKLCKQIESDAHFPKTAKIILKRSLPRLACKWLNKSGVSAEFQDEVAVVTALLLIVQHDRKMHSKLDELIAAQKPAEPVKPPAAVASAPTYAPPVVLPDPARPPGAPPVIVAKPVSEPTLMS